MHAVQGTWEVRRWSRISSPQSMAENWSIFTSISGFIQGPTSGLVNVAVFRMCLPNHNPLILGVYRIYCPFINGYWSKPYPPSEHQNSWDSWMFIPLKMVSIGFDPSPNGKKPRVSLSQETVSQLSIAKDQFHDWHSLWPWIEATQWRINKKGCFSAKMGILHIHIIYIWNIT